MLKWTNVAGVASEGLYRVAGFHDDVEAIKMAFDKGDYSLLFTTLIAVLRSERIHLCLRHLHSHACGIRPASVPLMTAGMLT